MIKFRSILFFLVSFYSPYVLKSQDIPTWNDDIACLIYSHCTACHNPTGIAPFSLMEYEDVYNMRFTIDYVIGNGIMPPWPPDQNYSHFVEERVVSDEELQLIRNWVAGGAPRGKSSDALDLPVYEGLWQIADPDLSIGIPAYEVPDLDGEDLINCFVVETNLTEDHFITAFEFIPGRTDIVHHAIVSMDTSDAAYNLDLEDPSPGYECFGGAGSSSASIIFTYTPSSSPFYAPKGSGIRLPANSHIIFSIHYPASAKGFIDSSRVNFNLSSDPDLREIKTSALLHHNYDLINGPLYIPANTILTFTEEDTMNSPSTLLSIQPHAHLVCESMQAEAVTPEGEVIPLVSIPHWNARWQGQYVFPTPVILPKGSLLRAHATYNNTEDNPFNPNDPPLDVSEGYKTTDEMMGFNFAFLKHEEGDENIVMGETSRPYYQNCRESAFISTSGYFVFPNPVSGVLQISLDPQKFSDNSQFEIFNSSGASIFKTILNNPQTIIDLPSQITNGLYLYRIGDEKGNNIVPMEKLVIER